MIKIIHFKLKQIYMIQICSNTNLMKCDKRFRMYTDEGETRSVAC